MKNKLKIKSFPPEADQPLAEEIVFTQGVIILWLKKLKIEN